MNTKKTTLLAVLLALFAPVAQVFGSTYYYKMHLKVSSNSTGKGLVYAKANTTSLPSDATFTTETTVTHSRSDNKSVNTGAAFAKANYGYVFKGWSSSDNSTTYVSTDNPYTPVVSSSATKESSAATQHYYAVFEDNPNSYTLVLNKPEGLANYTVTAPSGFPANLSQGGSATVYKGDQYSFKYTLSSDEYDFINWTVNGEQKTSNPVSVTISGNTTVVLTLKKKVTYTATCQGSVGGTYKANNTTVSGSDETISNFGSVTVSLSNPVANSGYAFYGWYILHPNGVKEYLSYYTSASTGEKKDNITVGAEFREVQDCTVNFIASAEGKITYAISSGNSGEVDDADKSETVSAGADVTLTATCDYANRRAKWYTKDDRGEKVYFSIDNPVTKTFASSATLGVDFVPVNEKIVNAIEAAQSSSSHEAILAADAEIVLGTSIEIPSGITIDLDGHTLYVDGTLTVKGTLVNGTVSKCLKLLKQTGDGLSPCNPYGSIKYWKTATATPEATIAGFSDTAKHVTIIRGDGVAIRKVYTGTPAVLKCKANADIAVNHIISITSTDDSKTRTSDGLTCPDTCANAPEALSKSGETTILVIVDSGVSIAGAVKSGDSQNRYLYQGVVDCAGYDCGGISTKTHSDHIVTYLNGGTVSVANNVNVQNSHLRFCNCKSVTNTGKARNTPRYYFYDCELTSLSFSASSDGGTAIVGFFGGKYVYSFGGITDSASRIYAGAFKDKPDKDKWVIEKLRSTMTFSQHADSYWYLEPNQDPNVARIDSTKYLTIEEALAYLDDNASATITLLRNVRMESAYTLEAGKSLVIELNGCHIDAPNGFVKNYGSLSIRDNNNSLAVCGVTVGSGSNIIENYDNGTADICYGLYNGNFAVNGGTFTTHHGKFVGSVVNNGGAVNIKGGEFSSDVSALLDEEYHAFSYGGWYYVGRFPKPEEGASSIANFARVLTAMPAADKTLYLAKKTYSLASCSSVDEWKRVAELKAAYVLYDDEFNFDILVGFDQDIAANTVQATVDSKFGPQSDYFPAMNAGVLERIFSPRITQNPISYKRFIYDNGEGNYDTMEAGVSDVNNANAGTACVLAMDLWKFHDKTKTTKDSYLTILALPYVFGAGNNVAMIRPATGTATFKSTLQGAIDAVKKNGGGTVMLANNCNEIPNFDTAGTYIVDSMGFEHGFSNAEGGYTVAEGLSVTTEIVDSSVATLNIDGKAVLPDAVAIKYVVVAGSAATAVDAPTAVSGLVYDGTEKIGVAAGTGYTLSGNTATTAGSYTATATLEDGYVWSDDSSDAKEISWSIGKASLTATAENKSVIRGETVPYTIAYSGFVNGEDDSALTSAPIASCDYNAADMSATATSYPITLSGGAASNYDLALVSGTLTVNQCVAIIEQGGETGHYTSLSAAVEATSGNTISVTVTANDTETVTLPQGKTLVVTVNDGVEATVTVNPTEGEFVEAETSGTTTTYVSKKITVEMEEPPAQATVEVVKVDHGVTNAVSDASLVNEAVHALTGNHDVSRTDNTDKLDVLDVITVTPTKIVEEVVESKTIIRSATFDVVPHLNAGQTLGEGQTLKFRLPVDAAATQLAAIVYHAGAQFGIFAVQTYNGEKFVEVESADFSPYGYELLDGETANPVAAIGTTGYVSLAAAVSAASAGDTITMLTDVELDEAVDIAESITLDLNGKMVSISAANEDGYAISVSSGTVTITGNGTIDAGDDIALDVAGGSVTIANGTFGVVGVDDGSLTVTGGTFNDELLTAGGTTTINGGTFNDTVQVDGGSVTINGGTFFSDDNVLVVTDSPGSITVNGGTFTVGTSGIVACAQGGGSIEVTDGTFSGGSLYTDTDGTITISGGIFDDEVPQENCAEGYIPAVYDEATGLYTVTSGYQVTFVDEDGTTVLFATNVAVGGTAVYEGATPTKPADANGVYTFSGWDPAITAVSDSAQTYTAQFDLVNYVAKVFTVDGATTNVIGSYTTLQAAVDAASIPAYAEPTTVTVLLLADTTEVVTVTQKANLNLVVSGNSAENYPAIYGALQINGGGRTGATETLEIRNIAFNHNANATYAGSAFVLFLKSGNACGHNVTIKDCSFEGDDNWSLNAINAQAGSSAYNLSLDGVSATKLNDLVIATSLSGIDVRNCTTSDIGSALWFRGNLHNSPNGLPVVISNNVFTTSGTGAIAFLQGSDATINLIDNTFVNQNYTIYSYGDGITATVNFLSGSYTGIVNTENAATTVNFGVADGSKTVTIVGVTETTESDVNNYYAIHDEQVAVTCNGHVTVNPGVAITGNVYSYTSMEGYMDSSAAPQLDVLGGTLQGDIYAAGTLNVSGGSITGDVVSLVASDSSTTYTGSAVVSGGEVNGKVIADEGTASITGGAVSGQVLAENGGTLAITVPASGTPPVFTLAPDEVYCVDCGVVPNTDAMTSAAYPYTVAPLRTVTFVNYDNRVLFTTNIAETLTPVYLGATPTKSADASGVYTFSGWDPAITAVSDSAQTYTAQYSVATYVAQIVTNNGATTNKYTSLSEAVSAANAGDTITMLADDRVSLTNGQKIEINKPLTITGPVDANGVPLYTIYGTPSNTGYNDVFVTSSSGTVTISNLAFAEFGNEAANSVNGHAPIFVSSENNNVVLENLSISDFNRTAIKINGGEFLVKDCSIDCDTDVTNYRVGGIDIANDATGSIVGTTIVNVDTSNPTDWVAAALEIIGSGDILVEDCSITSSMYGIFVSTAAGTSPGSSAVTVVNTTVEADVYSLINDSDSADAEIAVESGSYTGLLYAETETGLAISGGMFDDEVPEEYCADGYIPTDADPVTGLYTVKRGSYVAQIVRGGEVIAKYESFDDALDAAVSGDTVQLLTDITGVTETFELRSKNITIDGDGYSITAAENTEPRSVVDSWSGARNLFVAQSGDVTFQNIVLDGGETHYYTFLVQSKGGTTTFEDVVLAHGGEADSSGTDGLGYGAAVQVDGGTVFVTGDFIADTGSYDEVSGDRIDGIFPFTALLFQDGAIGFDNGVDVDIGGDLLLVGMVGAVDVSTDAGREEVEEKLEAMNVPDGFYPYTLKVGDDALTSFTGASPLGWNGIIEYGRDIMTVADSLGMEMNPDTTPVETGLLSDTVLPETFTFEDDNFTVNGNGYALSGTIEYTDDAGILENIVLGTEEDPLVLDMTGLSEGNAIHLGSDIAATNVVIKVTEEQATTMGHAIVTWDAAHESEEEAESLESGIVVEIVNAQGEPILDPATNEPREASVIWDIELGVAYIGPCEARLTGPTHEKAIYTTLADAIARAANSGDTVTLLMDIQNFTGTQDISKSLTLDGAGHTIAAAPVSEHRDVVNAWAGSTSMFKLQTGDITFRNITLDGDATHAYTFLISANNSSVCLTTENIRLLNGGELCGDENGDVLEEGAGYGAAIHLNNGAALVVSNGFYACTGGEGETIPTGVFPFTGILVDENGGDVKFELTGNPNDPANVDIGNDLLLVGMPLAIDPDDAQDILDYMQVPSRFIPYTLTLGDGDSSSFAHTFTGASPLGWNDIIDYGKDIMEVSTTMGYEGLDKETTPVEVGLLTDTVLPAGAAEDGYDFLYEDSNFSVNGNGNALSGTIKFTDDADGGMLRDIVLGTDENPLTLDLSATDKPIDLGDGVIIEDVVVLMTEEQAKIGKIVFDWDTTDELPPDDEQGVRVTVVDDDSGEPTGETKELVWDEDHGIAYIGPCEARLTDAAGGNPVYTTLAIAFASATNGCTVSLMTNVTYAAQTAATLVFDHAGATVTFDLNGFTFGSDLATQLEVEAGTLALVDSDYPAGDGGLFATNTAFLVDSGATLTISSGIYVGDFSNSGTVAISGGRFSDPVPQAHCAEGYIPATLNEADNPYTVVPGGFLVTVASVSNTSLGLDLVDMASYDGYDIHYELRRGSTTIQRGDDPAAFEIPLYPDDRNDSRNPSGIYRIVALMVPQFNPAVTNEIPSTNAVGVLKVTSSLTNTVAAVPWTALASNPAVATNVAVSTILHPANLSAGDRLLSFNYESGNYYGWTRTGTGTAATWAPMSVATVDGIQVTPAPENWRPAPGSAFWLTRETPCDATGARPFFLYGQLPAGDYAVTLAGGSSSLCANPTASAVTLDQLSFQGEIGADDTIVLTGDGAVSTIYVRNKANTAWGRWRKTVSRGMVTSTWTEDGSIAPGSGFWYNRRSSGDISLVWPGWEE